MTKITFIIPTIGRITLKNTIESLINQTNNEWKAIIIYDGIKSNIEINDERIKIIEIEKKGININNAGLVRNYGMKIAETEWIGFVDDDDILINDYVEIFYRELENEMNIGVKTYIYRMKLNDRIIPKLNTDNFYVCDVGISFIIHKDIIKTIEFIPDGAEDYLFLSNIREAGYKMVILPFIKYIVREKHQKIDIEGNRIYINKNIHKIILLGLLSLLKI